MSVSDDRLSDAIGTLATTLLPATSLTSTLETVAQLTRETIGGCRSSSVSLLEPNGRIVTAAVTDELASRVDELQYRAGEGPCLQAIRTGTAVRVPDLQGDTRFRRFAALAATEAPAVLSLPLPVEGRPIGGLNLYGGAPHSFEPEDEEAGGRLAACAAIVVANATAYDQVARLVQQLQSALESRAEIEQAKGIVMSQSRVGPEQAFDILRRVSQRENVKLRDVARMIVERAVHRAGPGEQPSIREP